MLSPPELPHGDVRAAVAEAAAAEEADSNFPRAYVERVPLVVINGTPSIAQFNSLRDQGVLYHHMVGGAARADKAIFEEITEIAVRIDNPATAPDLIDAALRTCITASRPVYLEIANQTVHGVMHVGWVPDGPGRFRGQMAVLVRPNGALGVAYLAAIAPFRHLVVYPLMMRDIGRAWRKPVAGVNP